MDILGLSTSPSSGGAYALILNENDGKRRLPIIIGTFEAQAIALELERIKPPRPMTHDLLRDLVKLFDATVSRVVINELKEGTFYARIICELEGRELDVDARPSDAIALAIRFKAPVYVARNILDEAGIYTEDETVAHVEKEHAEAVPVAERTDMESRLEQLQKNLTAAIENEEYEKAAKLRDEIERIKNN